MNELKDIIMSHYEKYPMMQIKDFIKLFYQNSFGPLHMSFNSNENALAEYIENELEYLIDPSVSNQIEKIGNDYLRVDLHMVKDGVISVKDLADVFYRSILSSPSMEDQDIELFTKQIEMLRYMVLEGLIKFDMNDVDSFIDEYLFKGIRPVHHSSIYKEHYQPHYRVVHKKFIKDIIGVEE